MWCCWKERAKPRNMGKKTKIFVLSLFLIYLGSLAADVVYSLRFRDKLVLGARSFFCEGFRFSDNVLNGYSADSHVFAGVSNLPNQMTELSNMVAPNGQVLQSVNTIVGQTSSIEFAVGEFVLYLNHMADVFGDATNAQVGNYDCPFCRSCCSSVNSQASMVSTASDAISSSLASGLVQTRATVADAMSGPTVVSVRDALASAQSTITDFTSQVESGVNTALIQNRAIFEDVVKYVGIATVSIVGSMGLPTLLLILAVFVGVFRSRQSSFSDPHQKPRNPCVASCGCCVSFLFAFFLFLLAGILGIVAYVLASTCEVIADPNELINLIATRTGSGSSGPMTDILNTCLTADGSGDLMGAIKVNGASARDSFDFTTSINNEFDRVSALVNSADAVDFSANPALVALFDAMYQFGSLYVLSSSAADRVDSDASLQPSPALVAAAGSPTVQALILEAVSGVPDCGGRTGVSLSGPTGDLLRQLLPNVSPSATTVDLNGLSALYAQVDAAGIDVGAASAVCPAGFASLNPPDATMAAPFDTLMNWRSEVLSHSFRCDALVVTANAAGAPQGAVMPQSCSWSDWLVYVDTMRTTLEAKAQAVDAAQDSALTGINTDLRAVVQGTVVPAVDGLVNSMDCKFMHERYVGIYEGLCWIHAPGMIGSVITWLVFGGLYWLCIIIEFVIWRHLKDNMSIWRDSKECEYDQFASVLGSQADSLPPTAHAQASLGYNANVVQMT